jgi:hypothetical protein
MQSNDSSSDTPVNSAGDAYEVGFGKPPKHTRFRAGQSGNPAGRRNGIRDLMTDVNTLVALGRSEGAIAVFDDVLARFGAATELPLKVANARHNKDSSLEYR